MAAMPIAGRAETTERRTRAPTLLGPARVASWVAFLLAVLVPALVPGQVRSQESTAYQKQVRLTEQDIARFVAVSQELVGIGQKLRAAGTKTDDILDAQEKARDEVSRRHGYANGEEHLQVDFNIWLVIFGLNTGTGAYVEPIEPLQREIAALEADKSGDTQDRLHELQIMKDHLALLQPLQFKQNIDLVRKYLREIEGVRMAQFMIAIQD